jgi:hypothetical protein
MAEETKEGWLRKAVNAVLGEGKKEKTITEEDKRKQKVLMEEIEPQVRALFELCKAKGMDCVFGIDCGTKAIKAAGNFTGEKNYKHSLAIKALTLAIPKEREKFGDVFDGFMSAFVDAMRECVRNDPNITIKTQKDEEE